MIVTKGSVYKCLTNSEEFRQHCNLLQSECGTREQVVMAGSNLMMAVYGGKDNDILP
jgi:hypothetical protein